MTMHCPETRIASQLYDASTPTTAKLVRCCADLAHSAAQCSASAQVSSPRDKRACAQVRFFLRSALQNLEQFAKAHPQLYSCALLRSVGQLKAQLRTTGCYAASKQQRRMVFQSWKRLMTTLEQLEQQLSQGQPSVCPYTVLPEHVEADLLHAQWHSRDVLVGSLRNRTQLEVCLTHRFYHVPVIALPSDCFPIRYIAIYQSKTFFGKEGGISYYGKVARCTRVRRNRIRELPKDSRELYYRFEVEQWKALPAPIRPKETRFAHLFTTQFLLLHSEETPELTLSSEQQFRFYQALRKALGAWEAGKKNGKLRFPFGEATIAFEKETIRVYRGEMLTAACLTEDFRRTPKAALTQLWQTLEQSK